MRSVRDLLLGLVLFAILAVSLTLVLLDFPVGAPGMERADAPSMPKSAPAREPAEPPAAAPHAERIAPIFSPDRIAPIFSEVPADKATREEVAEPAAKPAIDATKTEPPPLARLNLTAAQQDKVRDILLTHSIMQAAAPDFPLRQGASVPEAVPLLPLPHELAGAVPNFQRYSYVIAQDRIVIVVTERREIGFLISI